VNSGSLGMVAVPAPHMEPVVWTDGQTPIYKIYT
jgi:hypothetical protein